MIKYCCSHTLHVQAYMLCAGGPKNNNSNKLIIITAIERLGTMHMLLSA